MPRYQADAQGDIVLYVILQVPFIKPRSPILPLKV